MSDSDDDLFAPVKRPSDVARRETGPEFLRMMMHEERLKSQAEERARNDFGSGGREGGGDIATIGESKAEESDSLDADDEVQECPPFFLHCPPCQPAVKMQDLGAGIVSEQDLRSVIRDLHLQGLPFTAAARTALATLAVFHGDGGIRGESRQMLCADLKTDRQAWAMLQSVLLCALCDVGFPEDQLGEPLAICLNESGAPRTLVCFHSWGDTRQGPRVNVRTDTSQIW